MASEKLARAALVTALLLVAPATVYAAAPTAADRENARALITEGNARRDNNDLKGALAAFEGADSIMHVPTTGLAVAYTRAALGLLVDARDVALEVARSPVAAGEPKAFAQARKSAEELAEELAPRIPTLRIVLQGAPPGAVPEVTVAGTPIPLAALVVPRRLNPGHYVVVGKLGAITRGSDVDLAEKDDTSVTIDFSEAPVAAVVPPAADPKPLPTEKRDSGRRTSPVVYAGFGVGGVGLIVGSVTGIMSISKKATATESCVGFQCPPAVHGDVDSAKSLALVSTIGFVVAGVGAAAGVAGIVFGGSKGETGPTSGVHASAWVGPSSAGVRGEF